MSVDFKIVIPARYASTRFPGKPLEKINGLPMIQYVHQVALKSGSSEVVIATDDERIFDAAKSFGADVMMTSTEHETGTDRLAEVTLRKDWAVEDIVVNLQGDEPLTPPGLLQQVAMNLANNSKAGIATLSTPLKREEEIMDPNIVKVVTDAAGFALYFSRAPIPWKRDNSLSLTAEFLQVYQRHIGMYAYRVGFLHAYSNMQPCALENLEKLEQLRALYSGIEVHVEEALELPGPGVDTPDDLIAVSRLLKSGN